MTTMNLNTLVTDIVHNSLDINGEIIEYQLLKNNVFRVIFFIDTTDFNILVNINLINNGCEGIILNDNLNIINNFKIINVNNIEYINNIIKYDCILLLDRTNIEDGCFLKFNKTIVTSDKRTFNVSNIKYTIYNDIIKVFWDNIDGIFKYAVGYKKISDTNWTYDYDINTNFVKIKFDENEREDYQFMLMCYYTPKDYTFFSDPILIKIN